MQHLDDPQMLPSHGRRGHGEGQDGFNPAALAASISNLVKIFPSRGMSLMNLASFGL